MIDATFAHHHYTPDGDWWIAKACGLEVISKDCTHALCRALVAAGIPDQQICFHKPGPDDTLGMALLTYGSIHEEAKWQLYWSSRGIMRGKYAPPGTAGGTLDG